MYFAPYYFSLFTYYIFLRSLQFVCIVPFALMTYSTIACLHIKLSKEQFTSSYNCIVMADRRLYLRKQLPKVRHKHMTSIALFHTFNNCEGLNFTTLLILRLFNYIVLFIIIHH